MIFIEKNVGGFFQDEWKVRSNLSLAAGLRYDWQNYFGDANNLAPRLAVAYAPGRTRNWVIRAGAGSFFERSGPGPIWDILNYDGTRQRRYVLSGAQIPVVLSQVELAGLPTSIHRLQPGVELPAVMQFSAGLERQLSKKTLLALTYNGVR
ncbi:MAG: TonB-dependent receptor domain-containing protein, partial [Gammaproteobacteria bacterium]